MAGNNTTRDWMKIAVGGTILGMFIFMCISIVFIPHLHDNPLVAHILGVVEGALATVYSFYYGTSKSSEDKTRMLTKTKDDGKADTEDA